ncbi:hypothetical protein ZWY2020_059492 [Hordeum vulgare]|nr:hypothetical protein ZWY2020_059492 [Hordeum vulgare]
MEPAARSRRPLEWSCTHIIFDGEDHPDRVTVVGCLPPLVYPIVCNLKVRKMLVDSGVGMNLIYPKVVKRLYIPDNKRKTTGSFQGINPVRGQLKGNITLPVTFGGELIYRAEKVIFDVVELSLPYNGVLGRLAKAKFIEASHYAYNVLKMPGPMGVISISSNKKDAVICIDQMYQDQVAAKAAGESAPARSHKKEKKSRGNTGNDSKKRTSTECVAPVDDLPESSTGRLSKVSYPGMKKVPEGGWMLWYIHRPCHP